MYRYFTWTFLVLVNWLTKANGELSPDPESNWDYSHAEQQK